MASGDSTSENVFVANELFPDAAAVFSWQPKPIDSVKGTCMVVLDTSVLLLPYEIVPAALPEIQKTLRALVAADRLRIPGQVAREFARERPHKIMEVFQQINSKKSKAVAPEGGKYPLLEEVEEYRAVIELETELRRVISAYQQALSAVASTIRSWEWNDPLSTFYASLITPGIVIDVEAGRSEITAELNHRRQHRLPPGYKDAGKNDNPAGDLLVWKAILEIGKSSTNDLILATADRKSDWWHKSSGEGLYPRYELVEEYRRASQGGSFHAVTLSRLLELVGASDEVVSEVRQEESESQRNISLAMLSDDWPVITHIVNSVNRRTAALLSHAWPVSVSGRTIEIDSAYEFHAKRLGEKDVRRVIEDAIESLYGQRVYLKVVQRAEPESSHDALGDVPF